MDAIPSRRSDDLAAAQTGEAPRIERIGREDVSRSLDCILVQAESGSALDDWREINRRVADVRVDAAARHDFRAQITAHHLGRSLALQVHSVAQTLIRNRATIRRSGIDHIAVTTLLTGHAVGEFQGRLVEISAGDAFCIDYAKEFRLRMTDFSETVLVVPRRFLPQNLRSSSLHGLVMSGDNASTRLLVAYLTCLTDLAVGLSPEASAVGIEAACLLIQGARGRADTDLRSARESNQGLLREVLDFVDSQIANQELGYDLIMGRFKLSKSTLYRLFEGIGGVNAYIVGRRLDACHDELARDVTGTTLIGQVAFSYGFLSQPHFTRLFKKRFGFSPRHVRGMAIGAGHAGQRTSSVRSRPADILNDWLQFSST